MKKLILSILMMMNAVSAFAIDVVPTHLSVGALYVRVTKLNANTIKFEECNYGYESQCKLIGKKNYYTREELISQRTIENWQVLGAIGADLLVVVGGFYTGAYAGQLIGMFAGFFGAGAGTVAGATTAIVVDSINPHEQNLQANTLEDEVINDKTVQVNNVSLFISRLKLVLAKI